MNVPSKRMLRLLLCLFTLVLMLAAPAIAQAKTCAELRDALNSANTNLTEAQSAYDEAKKTYDEIFGDDGEHPSDVEQLQGIVDNLAKEEETRWAEYNAANKNCKAAESKYQAAQKVVDSLTTNSDGTAVEAAYTAYDFFEYLDSTMGTNYVSKLDKALTQSGTGKNHLSEDIKGIDISAIENGVTLVEVINEYRSTKSDTGLYDYRIDLDLIKSALANCDSSYHAGYPLQHAQVFSEGEILASSSKPSNAIAMFYSERNYYKKALTNAEADGKFDTSGYNLDMDYTKDGKGLMDAYADAVNANIGISDYLNAILGSSRSTGHYDWIMHTGNELNGKYTIVAGGAVVHSYSLVDLDGFWVEGQSGTSYTTAEVRDLIAKFKSTATYKDKGVELLKTKLAAAQTERDTAYSEYIAAKQASDNAYAAYDTAYNNLRSADIALTNSKRFSSYATNYLKDNGYVSYDTVKFDYETAAKNLETAKANAESAESAYNSAINGDSQVTHSWKSTTVIKAATCTTAGTSKYACTICGATKTETTAALGHAMSSWTTTTKATCTKAGKQTRKCTHSGCNYSESKTLAATGHKWDNGKITMQATCSNAGVRTYTCSACGTTKVEAIAKTAHTWSSWKTTKAATCKEAGSKQRSCTVCKTKQTESIAKTNKHTWGEWKTTKAPTHSQQGSKEHSCSVCGAKETQAIAKLGTISWTRLWGDSRYDTMKAISSEGWSSSNAVVLASGGNFPDALAASAFAGAKECPVLLTDPSNLSQQARSEIKRLGASEVYIVGGPAAVSNTVARQVWELGCSVGRFSGNTRQETASVIAYWGVLENPHSSTCIIASGTGFADALSISPYAYSSVSAIYLADGNTTVSADTLNSIKQGCYSRAIIVGGTGVVSASAEGALKSIGISEVVRLGGANRYETSSKIAKWCVTQGMSTSNVGVACGGNFPDALAGAALCGKNNSAIVLANNNDRSCITGFINSNKASITKGYVFGGEAVVSAGVWSALPNQ